MSPKVSSPVKESFRLTRTLLLLCTVLLCGLAQVGCSITPPPAGRYFDRTTPIDTVKMFQYSIEVEQYKTAGACMTQKSREILPAERFWLALDRPIKELGGATLRQLIIGSDRFLTELDPETGEAVVTMLNEESEQRLYLKKVEEWFIDLPRTLAELGLMAAEPAG